MSHALRLLRIEAHRNLGVFLFPFVIAGILFMTYEALPVGVLLWPETALSIHITLVLTGPLAAGVGAWSAIRNKRRGIQELLATTSYSPAGRDLTRLGATAAWLAGAYIASAALVLMLMYLDGAWGSPVLWPVLLGLLALVFDTVFGYAVGYYLPSLITPPIVAIVAYWVQGGAAFWFSGKPAQYLSPVPDTLDGSVFFGVIPHIFVPQSLFLLGLLGFMLAAIALRAGGYPLLPRVSLVASMILTAIGVAMLLNTPTERTTSMKAESLVPYEPKCVEKSITVCVHPAYSSLLEESAAVIGKVSKPFASLPGGPERAEQAYTSDGAMKDGTINFFLYDSTSIGQLAQDTAMTIVVADDKKGGFQPNPAQAVVVGWALKNAGEDYESILFFDGPSENEAVKAAILRFDELNEKNRSAWLVENFERLRTGEVDLDELP